jgi:3',5'-cyclic AMP phosphodiesterase CpdA
MPDAEEAAFSFVALNDLHYAGSQHDAWLERLCRQVASEPEDLDFCLMLGDLVQCGTLQEMTPVRDALAGLPFPVYTVIGNHDYTPERDRSAYETLFPGRLNYRFQHRGWHLLGLDTTQGPDWEGTLIPPATLEWAHGAVEEIGPEAPVIVFTHFPLGTGIPMRPRNADALLECFRGANLKAVFCGHYHGWTEQHWHGALLTTNRCCSPEAENHDRSPQKGYAVYRVEGGVVSRRFVPVGTVP